VGCYIWYSEEGTGRGRSPPRFLLAVLNVTAHPSTAGVPITVLLYNGPLLCGFNVPIKGLRFEDGVNGQSTTIDAEQIRPSSCVKSDCAGSTTFVSVSTVIKVTGDSFSSVYEPIHL